MLRVTPRSAIFKHFLEEFLARRSKHPWKRSRLGSANRRSPKGFADHRMTNMSINRAIERGQGIENEHVEARWAAKRSEIRSL
jgi:hypothetical protein